MGSGESDDVTFGKLLRRYRRERTLAQVARALEDDGHPTSVANLSAWERGAYLPKSFPQVEAVERVLGCEGELTAVLGWEPAESSRLDRLEGEVGALRDDVGGLRSLIEQLERRLAPGRGDS